MNYILVLCSIIIGFIGAILTENRMSDTTGLQKAGVVLILLSIGGFGINLGLEIEEAKHKTNDEVIIDGKRT